MERIITYPKIECPHCHCSYTFDKDDIKQNEDYKKVDPDTGRSIYERKFYCIRFIVKIYKNSILLIYTGDFFPLIVLMNKNALERIGFNILHIYN